MSPVVVRMSLQGPEKQLAPAGRWRLASARRLTPKQRNMARHPTRHVFLPNAPRICRRGKRRILEQSL
ncbi:hypothetical protein CMEL01_09144 [Colletotrichum melonis]|uniref:Uncharacterized protein n=2 Tax=Colletotrichum acutatum species complex TaxID=2707335 RepID=A0AAI9Z3H6_9PEZI|nr:uncharacterized protein CCOS01_04769 [Colletotrichum costaricense]KAK1447305.1 hypothetical protein CMEL01_09144 [Colletotrichum melonis]KAK1532786.1 hypothetical protein CCOS01_04769 [Colletotrichum costaricense]